MKLLHDNLTQAGQTPEVLMAADGSRLLALPSAGRVLALYPPGADENFIWTHPALVSASSAADFFRRGGWRNVGGDRTWLAPEIDLFIGDLERPVETYAVPVDLDPGQWRSDGGVRGLRFRNESSVRLRSSGRAVRFAMTKEVRPAANPLRDRKTGLAYAGYEQATVLELDTDLNGAASVCLGVWNLLQLPKPGRMIVPTYHLTEPRTVFGQVPPGDLALGERALVWEMPDGGGNVKLSVKASALTGRAGYLYRANDPAASWNLVIRNFDLNLSGEYVDALWSDPARTGYGFQACAVNEGAESFNELEYHAPAAVSAGEPGRAFDRSQVWAFRGGFADIAEAARVLLGIDDIKSRRPTDDRLTIAGDENGGRIEGQHSVAGNTRRLIR